MTPTYGPNATTGVVAIYSRRYVENKTAKASFNGFFGGSNVDFDDNRLNSQIGYTHGDVSFNLFQSHENRGRHQRSFFSVPDQQYIEPEEFADLEYPGSNTAAARFSRASQAMRSDAYTLVGRYEKDEDKFVEISSGWQESHAWIIDTPDAFSETALRRSESYFVNSVMEYDGLFANVAWTAGQQGTWQHTLGDPSNPAFADFANLDARLGYRYQLGNFELRPELGYREAAYKADFLVGPGYNSINNVSGAFRVEYDSEPVKLIGAVRRDFNSPNSNDFTSYNLNGLYDLNRESNLRFSYGRSFRSFFVFDTFIDGQYEPFEGPFFQGNADSRPYKVDTWEVGYRSIFQDVDFEITGFLTNTKDRQDLVFAGLAPNEMGPPQINLSFEESSVESRLYGLTGRVTYFSSEVLSATAFATLQESRWRGNGGTELEPIPGRNRFSPVFYGGTHVTVRPMEGLSLNSSLYWLHYKDHRYSSFRPEADAVGGIISSNNLDSNLLLTLTTTYQINEAVTVQLTGRNISLSGEEKQFPLMDDIEPTYYLGLKLNT